MDPFDSKNMSENIVNIKVTLTIFLNTTNSFLNFFCRTLISFITSLCSTFACFRASKIKKIISFIIYIGINSFCADHFLISICTYINTLFSIANRMTMFRCSIWLTRIISISKKRAVKLIIHISLFVSLPIFFCSI